MKKIILAAAAIAAVAAPVALSVAPADAAAPVGATHHGSTYRATNHTGHHVHVVLTYRWFSMGRSGGGHTRFDCPAPGHVYGGFGNQHQCEGSLVILGRHGPVHARIVR